MKGIYKISNPEGKIYIGYSTSLETRVEHYKKLNIMTQPLIKESIEKYGWEHHAFSIIEECEDNIIKEREKYYIKLYNSFNNGLNSNKGGGGPLYHTDQTKQKISEKGKLNKGKRVNSHLKGRKLPQSHVESNKNNKGKRVNSHRKGKSFSGTMKSILQYDLEGNFIKEWNSIKEININFNKSESFPAIGKCCRGERKSQFGFIWEYK